MYLFLLEREADLDEVEGFVVSASGVYDARVLAASRAGDESAAGDVWFTQASCTCIGISYGPEGIVLRAFNAG